VTCARFNGSHPRFVAAARLRSRRGRSALCDACVCGVCPVRVRVFRRKLLRWRGHTRGAVLATSAPMHLT
jgi:hypothetical protein